jgi:molybdopterin converting factor small subunit
MSFSIVAMGVGAGRPPPARADLRIGRVSAEDEWYRPGMTDAAGTIRVKLFAGLELRTPEGRATYEFDPREVTSVGAVIETVRLQPGAAGLVLVNGVHARPEQALGPGDEVALFPPLGGG